MDGSATSGKGKLGLTVQLPIIGKVKSKDSENRTITIETRGGTEFEVRLKATTWFDTVVNLDRLARQRTPIDDLGSSALAGEHPVPWKRVLRKETC